MIPSGHKDREGPKGTDPELLGAGNGRQAPITIKVAFLGSILGPSALFDTGYRHGANGDGKEPRVRRNSRLGYVKKEYYNSLHGKGWERCVNGRVLGKIGKC
eukprot:scaffold10770_cov33-Attheya_sp.AAC.2